MGQAGRPSLYREEYCDLLVQHFSYGYSLRSFLGRYGIARRTFYDWLRRYPDFKDAYGRADAAALWFWERMLMAHLIGNFEFLPSKGPTSKATPRLITSTLSRRWSEVFGRKARMGGCQFS